MASFDGIFNDDAGFILSQYDVIALSIGLRAEAAAHWLDSGK
jgi:hypothetical protein